MASTFTHAPHSLDCTALHFKRERLVTPVDRGTRGQGRSVVPALPRVHPRLEAQDLNEPLFLRHAHLGRYHDSCPLRHSPQIVQRYVITTRARWVHLRTFHYFCTPTRGVRVVHQPRKAGVVSPVVWPA